MATLPNPDQPDNQLPDLDLSLSFKRQMLFYQIDSVEDLAELKALCKDLATLYLVTLQTIRNNFQL